MQVCLKAKAKGKGGRLELASAIAYGECSTREEALKDALGHLLLISRDPGTDTIKLFCRNLLSLGIFILT